MSNRSLELQQMESSEFGGEVLTDSTATGVFYKILAATDITLTATGNITGVTSISVKAGVYITGKFTSVTVVGTAILYNYLN